MENGNHDKENIYKENRPKENLPGRIIGFYYSGFKSMTVGKTLWIIILIKLFILFFVLKLFFFKNDLASYKTPEEKSGRVIENLTEDAEQSVKNRIDLFLIFYKLKF